MTEMVYGSMPGRVVEPVLPRWWRSIDRWSLTAVFALFGVGLLLGLAASVGGTATDSTATLPWRDLLSRLVWVRRAITRS